ncbi:prolyl oligopeptidase family serine peptidase [Solibacillus sp. FSL H8-0538]|uniref:prolyl oligopeptidase family serine peptidase n=1 Tax=Solibacillus sp. FSL H8-0538 TaxID=2921400 RepID=UPI0030F7766D
MIVIREEWKRIPLLHIYTEEMTENTPVVIFLHGFMSAKEHNLHYAYQLVEKGVRVILPDAYLHGERTEHLSEIQMNLHFWKIVMKSVTEVHTLYQELKLKKLLAAEQIGIAGTSMGGITTSGCLRLYNWIQAAGICMGTTSFTKLALHQLEDYTTKGMSFPMSLEQQAAIFEMLRSHDLEQAPEVFARCPIIFWHGQQDRTVPFSMSYPFYEQLQQQGQAEKTQFIVDGKAGHAVSRHGMLEVTNWLAQHLA